MSMGITRISGRPNLFQQFVLKDIKLYVQLVFDFRTEECFIAKGVDHDSSV